MEQSEQERIKNSILAADLIAELLKLPPGARVAVTQAHYWANSDYAKIYSKPEFDQELGVYVIGHSSQHD